MAVAITIPTIKISKWLLVIASLLVEKLALELPDRSTPGSRPGSKSTKQISGRAGARGIFIVDNSPEYSSPAAINAIATIKAPKPFIIPNVVLEAGFEFTEYRHASVNPDSRSSNNQVGPFGVSDMFALIAAPPIRLIINRSSAARPL